ncbi:serine/threonine-protein kinase [Actinomadura sp. SCN-SB]|uniref:serine/threonine-protein kinase n=1 Tax=Actinomadura sp. SCN-SB TaxID=3373092 RepID=UPI0037520E50
MSDFEEPGVPPRATRREPGVTRRDPYVPGPREDAGRTRRDGDAGSGGPLLRLPGELAERFAVVAELPVQGAESDLLLVRDAAGGEYVVKVFRQGYRADRDVWAKLPELRSPHVLRILETGQAEGRDYEVSEYAAGGNLRALMARTELDVTRVVEQLADGLVALHRAGIVHRDLKPENVLVLGADPVRLAIADFGLSKVLDQSVVFASSSRTLAYAAPESLSGQVSPARDWWSLGMIVRELATGRPPFAGLSETTVVDHLATRAVPSSDVADPRVRLLCRGLLTRDPRRRWTGEQVTEWLRGGTPVVAEESGATGTGAASAPPGAGLPFNGHRYTDRAELARALIEHWDYAAMYFFGRGESGEAWRTLREWLAEIPDDTRIGLIDGYLTTGLKPDVKLMHLVRWLDPALPPHHLGRRVTADDLPTLAALAGDPRHPDHRTACLIGRDLWDEHLLHVLAGSEGGHDLARIDDQWRAHVEAWNVLVRWLREHEATPPGLAARLPEAGTRAGGAAVAGGPPPPADDPPTLLLTLLALAARPAETRESIAEAAARARASVTQRVDWFEWIADGAGDDPLRLLAVARCAPEAVIEVEASVRDRRAAEQRAQELRVQWEERERQRLAARGKSMARAVAWSLPLLAFWLFGSWVVGALFGGGDGDGTSSVGGFQGASGVPFGVLVVFSLLTWGVQCASEVMLAHTQGRDYLPYGPWTWLSRLLGASGRGLAKASQTVSGAAQRTGRRGCGLLLLAGTVPLLLILMLMAAVTSVGSLLWLLLMAAAAAAHAVAAGVRLHRWRQGHTETRRRALEATS